VRRWKGIGIIIVGGRVEEGELSGSVVAKRIRHLVLECGWVRLLIGGNSVEGLLRICQQDKNRHFRQKV
jgi:hypothetical protein